MSQLSRNRLLTTRQLWISVQKRQFSQVQKPFPVLEQSRHKYSKSDDLCNIVNDAAEKHRKLLERCRSGGGAKAVERHTVKNKKIMVRDRIRALIDDESDFLEICATAGMDLEYGDVPCAGYVAGIAKIRGVHCMIMGSDASVKGGTIYPVGVTKALRCQELAHKLKLPTVNIVDSGGAFLPLQSDIFPDVKHGGRMFRNQAVMSSQGIPQIALVSGMCTAGAAYTPTMSDEVAIVTRIGNIYLGGPPLVKAAIGQEISGEELGGATLHCSESGITDYFAENEQESFDIVRDIVSCLNIHETQNDFNRSPPDPPLLNTLDYFSALDTIQKDDCYGVLASILDGSRFMEFKKRFGSGLISGFGFINGVLSGWLINCGPLTAADGQKGAHFVTICDSRGIPLIFLQNGRHETCLNALEKDTGITLKERAKLAQGQAVVQVPKISININGLFGDQSYTMCGPSFDPWFSFAWPRSEMSKNELALEDFKQDRQPNRLAQFWASRCTIDGVILPSETRNVIEKCIQLSMLNYDRKRGERGQGKMVFRM